MPSAPEPSLFPAHPPGTPENMQPPAQPVLFAAAAPNTVVWHDGLPAAAKAGLITAVLSVLPLISLGFFAWMILGGILAVTFYRRRRPFPELTAGMGARLGATAGLIGFALFAGFMALIMGLETVVLHQPSMMRNAVLQALKDAASRANDPTSQKALETLQSPGGMAFLLAAMLVFFLIFFLVLSTIGGAVSASLSRRRS